MKRKHSPGKQCVLQFSLEFDLPDTSILRPDQAPIPPPTTKKKAPRSKIKRPRKSKTIVSKTYKRTEERYGKR